jgi:hypothetical protein
MLFAPFSRRGSLATLKDIDKRVLAAAPNGKVPRVFDNRGALRIPNPQVIISGGSVFFAMFAVEIFRYRAELACPRCSSTNVDRKFQYMGEFSCRHCDFFWRNP